MKNNIIFISVLIFQLALSLCSCKGQTSLDVCIQSSQNAKSYLNKYYLEKDSSNLKKALYYTDQALKCEQTRFQSIERKVSILILLKKYKTGYEFIDSLKNKDFNKEYKKKMNYNFLKALEHDANADTLSAAKCFNEAITAINLYLKNNKNNSQIDKDAYYDLYFVKSKVLPIGQLEKELDSLGKTNPVFKDFFLVLKSSIMNTE